MELIQNGLGIFDATEEELQSILDSPPLSVYTFADMVSRRAEIGWATHGHSAVDVNVYGTAGSDALRGNHENIEIGQFLQGYLGVDVEAITVELKEKSSTFSSFAAGLNSWTGPIPTKDDLDSARPHYEKLYGKAP